MSILATEEEAAEEIQGGAEAARDLDRVSAGLVGGRMSIKGGDMGGRPREGIWGADRGGGGWFVCCPPEMEHHWSYLPLYDVIPPNFTGNCFEEFRWQ